LSRFSIVCVFCNSGMLNKSPGRRRKLGRSLSLLVMSSFFGVALFGCLRTDDVQVVITIELRPATGVAPLHVEFEAVLLEAKRSSTLEFRWDLGDGETALGQSVSHTYQEPGTYQVFLEAVDDKGHVVRSYAEVSVSAPPEMSDLRAVLRQGNCVLFWHDGSACLRVGEVISVYKDRARVKLLLNAHEQVDEYLSLLPEQFELLTKVQSASLGLVPPDYYHVDEPPPPRTTVEELKDVMTSFKFPAPYVRGVYEETHMAAYLEAVLEGLGFDARIAVGPGAVVNDNSFHSWVIVYLSGSRIAIEVTDPSYQWTGPLSLVYSSEPSLCPYYSGPDLEVYNDIYVLAVLRGLDGFDWW